MVIVFNSGFSFTFIRWNFSAIKCFLSSTRAAWLLETQPVQDYQEHLPVHCFFPGQGKQQWDPYLGTLRGTSGAWGWGWGWVLFLWVTLWPWGTASRVFLVHCSRSFWCLADPILTQWQPQSTLLSLLGPLLWPLSSAWNQPFFWGALIPFEGEIVFRTAHGFCTFLWTELRSNVFEKQQPQKPHNFTDVFNENLTLWGFTFILNMCLFSCYEYLGFSYH